MGKATRWFRSLFGAKKSDSRKQRLPKTNGSSTAPGVSSADQFLQESSSLDANKHAIAVAAATAAVAEAALAAAHAAAEVVRLTSAGGGSRGYYDGGRRRELAAVKIQSAFRAYLARRALRALKGLVKLQALVRGHIVRKQSADMLRRMQAMARVQARASASRACLSVSPHSSTRSSSHSISHHHPRCVSTSNAKGSFGHERHNMGSNWLDNWMEETCWSSKYGRPEDEKSDKILEVDTWMPHLNQPPGPGADSTFISHDAPTKPQKPSNNQFTRTREMLPLGSMIIREAEKSVWTAENTPRVCSAASSRPGSSHKRSPFTPARSEYSRSVFGDYASHPNYMSNTESSRAKLRSHSAPRQRIHFEKSASHRRLWDYSDTNSERGFRC